MTLNHCFPDPLPEDRAPMVAPTFIRPAESTAMSPQTIPMLRFTAFRNCMRSNANEAIWLEVARCLMGARKK